ncbi:hypothetical protein [Microtetraspora malaysiensis]|uniref:hypothetical protein n=1 Tax=Microtetraspora malaysiensis TaxID=161358 RepID=UPI003D8E0416
MITHRALLSQHHAKYGPPAAHAWGHSHTWTTRIPAAARVQAAHAVVSAPGLRDLSETMLGMTTAPVRGYSCGPKISSTNSAVGRSDNAWIRT